MKKFIACIFMLFFSQLNCGFVIKSDFLMTDAEHHDETNSTKVQDENTKVINDTQNQSADILMSQNREMRFDKKRKEYLKNEKLQDQNSNIPKFRKREKWFDEEEENYMENEKLQKKVGDTISTSAAPLQQKQTKFKLTLTELITFRPQLRITRNSRTM